MKLKIAIFGGSGYGGSELLRILIQHPNAEIKFVTANEHAGKAVSDVHKNLLGLTELKFIKAPEDVEKLSDVDCAFFALPHGQAMEANTQRCPFTAALVTKQVRSWYRQIARSGPWVERACQRRCRDQRGTPHRSCCLPRKARRPAG